MWATAICPKCGTKNQVDLSELRDDVTCPRCLEQFTLPFDFQTRFDEHFSDKLVFAATAGDSQLDSSFWLS